MQQISEAQRQALWRAYQILLRLPAESADTDTQTEDADQLAGNAASSGGTPVVETERLQSLPQGAPTSTESLDSGGEV